LRKIKHFNMDLGYKLLNENKATQPDDLIVHKHILFHNELIESLGNIGKLHIYSKLNIDFNNIKLYNEKKYYEHKIDKNISFYDNINKGLDLFFEQNGIKEENKPKIKEEQTETKEKEYLKPNKPLKEMSMDERIAYARNFIKNG